MRLSHILILGIIFAVVHPGVVRATPLETPGIDRFRIAENKTFSDDEIKEGFFKTTFGAELAFDRTEQRIRKFDGPVRVYIVNQSRLDRRSETTAIVGDIRRRIEHLDLAVTDDRTRANVIVTLVDRNQLSRTIRSHFGARKAAKIEAVLAPQCLSGIAKDKSFRIQRAEVILPADAGDFTFYDCAYEELLQALGVVNDDNSVPWTMFNDKVQMGFFDNYDQHLLNILYDPRTRPGMTKSEVEKILPDVLPTVRAGVAKANGRRDLSSDVSPIPSMHPACICELASE